MCTNSIAFYFLNCNRMMKLVQKRKGDAEKPSSNGKVKKAKKSGSGSIQSGLQAFFKRSSNSAPSTASNKQKTPPTSPENSDVEVIEIDCDKGSSSSAKKRKQGNSCDCVEVVDKKQK